MVAFWYVVIRWLLAVDVFGSQYFPRVNYGCLLHVPAPAVYIVPLALQALPAL